MTANNSPIVDSTSSPCMLCGQELNPQEAYKVIRNLTGHLFYICSRQCEDEIKVRIGPKDSQ